jgi:hypothetical protein
MLDVVVEECQKRPMSETVINLLDIYKDKPVM